MCGRFTNVLTWRQLAQLYRITADRPALNLPARYNVAPTQDIPIIRLDAAGERELVMARWGLVPRWADDLKIGSKMINARAETVDEKPSFKDAFRRRRCLIPATGYFEWKKTATGKQPYLFAPAEGDAWSFAGLWERNDRTGQTVESCTIIVGPANDLAREIHDRMPVILDTADHETWLGSAEPSAIKALLRPYPAARMLSFPVSTRVGNVRNDDADLIQEISI